MKGPCLTRRQQGDPSVNNFKIIEINIEHVGKIGEENKTHGDVNQVMCDPGIHTIQLPLLDHLGLGPDPLIYPNLTHS